MFKKGVITDEISQDFLEAVKLAEKYKLDALEIRSVWEKGPHELNADDIKKMKDILKDTNLKICGISAPFFKCDIDSEPEIEQQYEILNRSITLAKEFDAPYIRGFTFWSKGNFDEYFDRIVSNIKNAGKLLEEAGLTLVIEMDPSVFASSAKKVAAVVGAVNMPSVKALWDPGNIIFNKGDEVPYPDGYNALKPYIAHMHLKDAIKKGDSAESVAFGTGAVDFKGQFKQLIKDGYDGYIVMETHYRKTAELSEELLALPKGSAFSLGGHEATEESLILLDKMLKEIEQ